jgi:hypothetical protein
MAFVVHCRIGARAIQHQACLRIGLFLKVAKRTARQVFEKGVSLRGKTVWRGLLRKNSRGKSEAAQKAETQSKAFDSHDFLLEKKANDCEATLAIIRTSMDKTGKI